MYQQDGLEILSASSQIQKMLAAYMEEQNMEKILSFVTPDICWKENEEVHLHGWQELEEFLKTVLVSQSPIFYLYWK